MGKPKINVRVPEGDSVALLTVGNVTYQVSLTADGALHVWARNGRVSLYTRPAEHGDGGRNTVEIVAVSDEAERALSAMGPAAED